MELCGTVLPEREKKILRIEGDRLHVSPAPDTAESDLWLLPGLVDVHTHPGMIEPGDPYDEDLFRAQQLDHVNAGVLLIRSPGTPEPDSHRKHDEVDLPRVVPGGQWLATPGRFFDGYGRHVEEHELVAAAVEEATATGGWCKIIGDWLPGIPVVPGDLMAATVAAVHAIGGLVAVHGVSAECTRNAVSAGADSIEHGLYLEHDLLPQMARQGTVLVPTFSAFAQNLARMRAAGARPDIVRWTADGVDRALGTVKAAHDAGVTVLAGTDIKPCGEIVGEVEWLLKAGLPAEAAIGSASWTARSWLGFPGLVDGAPADVTAYRADPVANPSVLRDPAHIILRGQVIR
ncbi:amidohydrolase family protein [Actinokineospora enzanensis]|uniref:amidohydrolase family protein n=1 Tax=Actinokineospora enzanensis TaxID=155975 RepID=UPI00039FCC45|nr:amidohydrolase family protein [Actinokineospora enzanensis]